MKSIIQLLFILLASLVWFISCSDTPFTPDRSKKEEPPVAENGFGLVEVTISGIGTQDMKAKAVSINAIKPPAGGNVAASLVSVGAIDLKPISNGSFIYGTRGSGGVRYLYASFAVRNAPVTGFPAYNTPRENLTFLAVDTDQTYGQTAVSTLRLFDGTEFTGTAAETIAKAIIPTGRVTLTGLTNIIPVQADVLQIFTETEANSFIPPAGVTDVFPYGFITRTPNVTPNSRLLPGNPTFSRYDGVVTFAFKIPLQAQANKDPFEISVMFLPVDDNETRITQSLEEQTPEGAAAFQASANALNTLTEVALLPGAIYSGTDVVNRICQPVRIAGSSGAPETVLFPPPIVFQTLTPDPYAADGSANNMAYPTRIKAGFSGRTIRQGTSSNFVVHGSSDGRYFIDGFYPGIMFPTVSSPIGSFFPGEQIEVTVTTGMGGCNPQTARYRARVPAISPEGVFDITFGPDNYEFTDRMTNIATSDFDGDGDIDLAGTSDAPANCVWVAMNDGTGTFSAETCYGVPNRPYQLEVGDVNGDSHPDLVVSDRFIYANVFLNDGDGTFDNKSGDASYTQNNGPPRELELGDLDQDGDLDIAVLTDGTAYIMKNNGNGAYAFAAELLDKNDAESALEFGDIDNDGDLDIVITEGYATTDIYSIFIMKNNGNGTTFSLSETIAVNDFMFSLEMGDLDDDGDQDLVYESNSNLYVYENNGSGHFSFKNFSMTGSRSWDIELGDLNGDGDLDLVLSGTGSNRVYMHQNNGGSFGSFSSDEWTDISPTDISTPADLDGDGDLDIAVVMAFDTLKILLNNE